MIDFVAEIADFFLDLWINKIINMFAVKFKRK